MTSPQNRNFAIAVVVGILTAAPGPDDALASEDARIRQLETDLQQLRIRIDEQARRIKRLEDELSRRPDGPLVGTIPGRHEHDAATTATADRLPWHSPEPWSRVTRGMTEAQVTAILGQPTSVESLDSYKTLFYRGQTTDGSMLSGHVNLRDDRVVAIRKPAIGPSSP